MKQYQVYVVFRDGTTEDVIPLDHRALRSHALSTAVFYQVVRQVNRRPRKGRLARLSVSEFAFDPSEVRAVYGTVDDVSQS